MDGEGDQNDQETRKRKQDSTENEGKNTKRKQETINKVSEEEAFKCDCESSQKNEDEIKSLNPDKTMEQSMIINKSKDTDTLMEIRKSVVHIAEFIDEFGKLEVGERRNFSAEAIQLLKANIASCEEAIHIVEEATALSVSFTDIPELPMKEILKYLTRDDKQCLRLVSKLVRNMIDCYDKSLNTMNIILYPERNVQELYQFFSQSDKNMGVPIQDCQLTDDMITFLVEHWTRIRSIRGQLQVFHELWERGVDGFDQLTYMLITNDFERIGLPNGMLSRASNLNHLILEEIDLASLKGALISLPELEEVSFRETSGHEGLPALLSSCSSSLKTVYFYGLKDVDFTSIFESDIKMKRLKKISFKKMSSSHGLFSMVSLASDSVEELSIKDTKVTSISLEEIRIPLPKLKYLKLRDCNPEYLYALHFNTSLVTINLCLAETSIIDDLTFSNNRVEKIIFDGIQDWPSFSPWDGVYNLIGKHAAHLKELDICNIELPDLAMFHLPETFPSLTKLQLSDCTKIVCEEIVRRCPNIEELLVDKYSNTTLTGHTFSRLQKLTFSQISGYVATFPEFPPNLSELVITEGDLDCHNIEFNPMNIRKLTIKLSEITGFFHLLEAIGESLTELVIEGKSHVDLTQLDEASMKCLTKVEVGSMVDLGVGGQMKLLKSCSNNLERLSLTPAQDIRYWISCGITLPRLQLINLYPKPCDCRVAELRAALPQNVMFLSFPF